MAAVTYDTIGPNLVKQEKASGRVTNPSPRVFQLEMRPGDTDVAGSGDNARCEIYVPKEVAGATAGAEQWWGFGIEGVSGPTPTGAHSMRFQWHGPNGTGQPQVVINTPAGKLNVRLWDAGTNVQFNFPVVDANDVQLTWANGVIYWFVNRMIHSTSPTVGLVEMWCNGVKFCSKHLQTLYTKALRGSPQTLVNLSPSEYVSYPKFGGMYTNDLSDTIVSRSHRRSRGVSMAEVVAEFPAGTGFDGIVPAPPPVIAQPDQTFGEWLTGSGTNGAGGDKKRSSRFLFPGSGDADVDWIEADLEGTSSATAQTGRYAIFADNAGTQKPAALLGISETFVIEPNAVRAKIRRNLIAPARIPRGVYYHLAIATAPDGGAIRYTTFPDGSLQYNDDTWSDGFSDPYGTALDDTTRRVSVLAHFEPVAVVGAALEMPQIARPVHTLHVRGGESVGVPTQYVAIRSREVVRITAEGYPVDVRDGRELEVVDGNYFPKQT